MMSKDRVARTSNGGVLLIQRVNSTSEIKAPRYRRGFNLCGLDSNSSHARESSDKPILNAFCRDLRQVAQAGYEGAVSTDHDQQAQAVGVFLTDTLFANLTA
jgi:hypothetical protein